MNLISLILDSKPLDQYIAIKSEWLFAGDNVRFGDIVVLTFTNKTANEIKERIKLYLFRE